MSLCDTLWMKSLHGTTVDHKGCCNSFCDPPVNPCDSHFCEGALQTSFEFQKTSQEETDQPVLSNRTNIELEGSICITLTRDKYFLDSLETFLFFPLMFI